LDVEDKVDAVESAEPRRDDAADARNCWKRNPKPSADSLGGAGGEKSENGFGDRELPVNEFILSCFWCDELLSFSM